MLLHGFFNTLENSYADSMPKMTLANSLISQIIMAKCDHFFDTGRIFRLKKCQKDLNKFRCLTVVYQN